MEILSKKNFLIALAAVLVVAFAIMAIVMTKRQSVAPTSTQYQKEIREMQTQGASDSVAEIEKDLNATDLSDVDKELQDIEAELNSSY